MSIKQLDLESIQDEVLDECFANENESVSLTDEIDDDLEVSTDDNETLNTSFSKIKDTTDFVPNETLLKEIAQGINVSANREKIVRQNYGLVHNEARKCTCNIPFHDKLQYGFEGLLNAMEKFDVNGGAMFSTYATASVRNVMYRNGNNDVRIVALPEYLSMHNIRIQNYVQSFVDMHQFQPTVEQIAKGTNIDIRSVKRVMSHVTALVSMDAPVRGDYDDVSLQDVISSDDGNHQLDETCMSQDFREGIHEAISHLNAADRKLFSMVNGFDGYMMMSFDEIIEAGFEDERGKKIRSKPTLSRRYAIVLEKVGKIIEREGIQLREK